MRARAFILAVILGLVLPWVVYLVLERNEKEKQQAPISSEPPTEPTIADERTSLPVLMSDGSVADMELEEYVLCVVLGEMPASFEPEALKAQSVVSRTYALRADIGKSKHTDAAVCTDSSCCQAFCTVQAYLEKGNSAQDLAKIQQAVEETKKQVLVYNGTLIEATYFSCSGGRTEDAQAVWGQDIPYLRSVESPGEESADKYITTVTIPLADLERLLQTQLSGSWLGEVSYTQGGGVDQITIGTKQYKGTELRRLLGLRSTAFIITAVGDRVTITTKGYGHRVGMSQYGADAMAIKGSGYEEILSYYYPGTVLQTHSLQNGN